MLRMNGQPEHRTENETSAHNIWRGLSARRSGVLRRIQIGFSRPWRLRRFQRADCRTRSGPANREHIYFSFLFNIYIDVGPAAALPPHLSSISTAKTSRSASHPPQISSTSTALWMKRSTSTALFSCNQQRFHRIAEEMLQGYCPCIDVSAHRRRSSDVRADGLLKKSCSRPMGGAVEVMPI